MSLSKLKQSSFQKINPSHSAIMFYSVEKNYTS